MAEDLKLSIPADDSSGRSSEVYFGSGICPTIADKVDRGRFTKCFILVDETLESRVREIIDPKFSADAEVLGVGPGESAKTLASVERIWRAFSSAGLDRGSLVICVGGGSAMDAGAFAASTYMRGLKFINVPTTLLAQADASIGGKTGINMFGSKNLIGTFALPDAVVIDVDLLASLPRADFASGMAEILKHAAIKDADLFASLEKGAIDLLLKPGELLPLLYRSCEIKAEIVRADPREKHLRRLLNFGHTLGHIAESQALRSNMPLRHGEAVALGMIGEARISEELGLSSPTDTARMKDAVRALELPLRSPVRISEDRLSQGISRDKKTSGNTPRWPLIRGIGASALDVNVPGEIAAVGAREIGLI